MKQDAFTRSNSINEVAYKRFSHRHYRAFISSSEDASDRETNAQALLDYLCDRFEIPHTRVRVVDVPQPRKNGTTFEAFYYFRSHTIKVFNLTAVKENPVSIYRLAVTILHEFMHHYDRKYLHIESTPHTKGFFNRIWDLKSKLQ